MSDLLHDKYKYPYYKCGHTKLTSLVTITEEPVKSKMPNLLYKISILFNLANNKMPFFVNANYSDKL